MDMIKKSIGALELVISKTINSLIVENQTKDDFEFSKMLGRDDNLERIVDQITYHFEKVYKEINREV